MVRSGGSAGGFTDNQKMFMVVAAVLVGPSLLKKAWDIDATGVLGTNVFKKLEGETFWLLMSFCC